MFGKSIYTAVFGTALLCFCSAAWAFDVSPLVHELSPAAGRTSTEFQVANSSDQPLTLEFQTKKLIVSESGVAAGKNADDYLLVFPPLVVVKPGAVQSVRVQLDAPVVPVQDESFLVLVEQLPLAINDQGTNGVQVLLSFNVVVHVSAPNSKVAMNAVIEDDASPLPVQPTTVPSIELSPKDSESVRSDKNTEAPESLNVRLTNTGNANAFGSRLELILSSDTESVVFSALELQAASNDLFFPPMHSRVITLALPDGRLQRPLTVSVSYDSSSL